MKTVTSKDGTTIAFDRSGHGPVVILVDGALQYRAFAQGMEQLAALLTQSFTVIQYDRRGRGDSTDKQPFAVKREIEDIEALIDEAGGPAFAYGISSGAALAMEAAIELGARIKKLAMYEAPFNDDEFARQAWAEYRRKLKELTEAGRRGDAVVTFYDAGGFASRSTRGNAPASHVANVGGCSGRPSPMMLPPWETMPLCLLSEQPGSPSLHSSWMVVRAIRLCTRQRCLLPRQCLTGSIARWEARPHEVAAEAIAPVLIEFFKS